MAKHGHWSTTKYSPREMHFFEHEGYKSLCGKWLRPKQGEDVFIAIHEESEKYNLCRACNYPFTIMFKIGGWYGV